MILGNNQRSNRRKNQRQKSQLTFEALEGRKMMAADVMSMANGSPEHVQMSGHDMGGNSRNSRNNDGCNHQAHHNPALMALVTDAQATHVAVGSGDWSSPATWQNGQVPTQGARIVIPDGQTITVDQVFNQEFKSIRVDGTLRFANNVNTQLKVDTLVSTACGRLEMGTTANPIQSNVTAKIIIADDGAINRNWDPSRISRGLLLAGPTEMVGAQTTDKVTLAVQPTAGTRTLQLSSVPTNWKAGDQLVITGTQGMTSDEVRTISSVNGTSVVLNQALQLDHITPKEGLNVYVANKTRNVEIRSENTSIKRRGHVMFMHNHNVKIDNAGFYDLGRTDKSKDLDDVFFEFTEDAVGNEAGAPIVYTTETEAGATNIRGRYALHFHRGGVDPNSTPATVTGSVVDGSPGWGFVNHSSNVNFTSNVAYGVWGSAFYTEAGDEVGTFDSNVAIRSVNPRSPIDPISREIATDLGHGNQEFGNSGDGFWLSGNLVSVKNNVSSGNSGHGIIIWSDGLVEHDLGADSGRTTVKTANIANGNLITGRTEIPTWWAPLAEVSNNEVSNATIGFRTRYIHSRGYVGEGGSAFHKTPNQAYVDTLNPVVDGLKVWGSREGVMLNYSELMSLKNAEIIGTGEAFVNQAGTTNVGVGLDLGNDISRGSGRIENVSIEGFGLGMFAPRNEQWVMENLNLSNTTDMLLTKPTLSPRTLTMSNVNFGNLNGTAVAGTEGQRRNIAFLADPEFTEFVGQPFGFLMPDQITIDGQQIYANYQNANYVPLSEAPEGNDIANVPSSWVGRTNQQLQNQIGLSVGGNITPAGSQTVDWITGGRLGPVSPASTQFPQLFDMTNGGFSPEPFPGGPTPELTGNRLEINRGQSVVFMNTNLNTTDTNTAIANLTYTVSQVQNGMFVHRDNPTTPITRFSQADVNGGVIRFVHDGSETAPDYRVRVSDGTTTTSLSTPIVTFDGQADGGGDDGGNDGGDQSPVANNDSANVAEDGSVRINVLANDTDPQGDQLAVQSFGTPSNGSVTNDNGTLVYRPNPNFNGSDSFTYTINDGNGNTASASVSVTIRPVNDSPVANDDSATTSQDTSVTIDVLSNDTDIDGDNLSIASFGEPSDGSVANENGRLVYTPNQGFSGTDSFTYVVTDCELTDSATVSVVVSQDTDDDSETVEIGFSGVAEGVNHRWKTISLPGSFENPVVVAGGATRVGGHQGVVRVRNVTSDSFQIRFQEWNYLDGRHAAEDIGYFVVEAGRHELTDGTVLVAGTSELIDERFESVEFEDSFSDTPVVIAQVMTYNGGAAVTDRIRNVSAEGFEVQMQEEEAADHRHSPEELGWIAIDRGFAESGETNLNAIVDLPVNNRVKQVVFGDIDDTAEPVILSDMQTRKGRDTATVRHTRTESDRVWLMIEEERSQDKEIGHTGESVGVLAFEPGALVAKTNQDSRMFMAGSDSSSVANSIAALLSTQSSRNMLVDNSTNVDRQNGASDESEERESFTQDSQRLQLAGPTSEISFQSEADQGASEPKEIRRGPNRTLVTESANKLLEFDSLDEAFTEFV